MHRLCTCVLLLGSLSATAIPAAAAASVDEQLTVRGAAASAYFTSAPSSPLPGALYTDTYVFAARDATTVDGTRYRDDAVYVTRYRYTVDEGGWRVYVGYAHGFAYGSDVALAITGGLSKARLDALVPMRRCEFRDGWEICDDAIVTPVSIAWTGEETVARGTSHANWSQGPARYITRYNGQSRVALATGTFGGDDLAATRSALLTDTKWMSLSICHAC